jgi:hypothetical protein
MMLLHTGNLYGKDRNDLTSFETLSQKRLVAIFFDPIVGIIKTISKIISCQFWIKIDDIKFWKILKV